jgi:hypothetical protein
LCTFLFACVFSYILISEYGPIGAGWVLVLSSLFRLILSFFVVAKFVRFGEVLMVGRPEVILVTGSPRGGTTPVGGMLKLIPGSVDLYEPMGPTGDRRFEQRFPMLGADDFTLVDLREFVNDLRERRLHLKSQKRPGHNFGQRIISNMVGSRTKLTYLLSTIHKSASPIIWKDPHAAFCATYGLVANFKSVITVRPPLAHAASYKRLGWVSDVLTIYKSYQQAFGRDIELEDWIDRVGMSPLGSAAILWRMIYSSVYSASLEGRKFYLLNFDDFGRDELRGYMDLFNWLDYPLPAKLPKVIENRMQARPRKFSSSRVHDFNRSATVANTYWQTLLKPEETDIVEHINGALWLNIKSIGNNC